MSEERAAYQASASEADIQRGIVQRLRLLGFVVLLTGQGRKATRCPGCGHLHHPRGYAGNTVGCPDLFIFIANRRLWLGMEVKKPGGAIRPEQRELAAAGMTVIVRSQEAAIAAVEEAMR